MIANDEAGMRQNNGQFLSDEMPVRLCKSREGLDGLSFYRHGASAIDQSQRNIADPEL